MMMMLRMMLVLMLIKATAEATSLAKPGCQDRCGNIDIPFPFGIGTNCSAHHSFMITCNTSLNPPKPFIGDANLEVLDIALEGATISVNNPQDVNLSRLSRSLVPLTSTYNQFTSVLSWKYTPCNSSNSSYYSPQRYQCWNYSSCSERSALCWCKRGFEGNPYLQDGCQDIDECAIGLYGNRTHRTDPVQVRSYGNRTCFEGNCMNKTSQDAYNNRCFPGTCHNLKGSYICICPSGYIDVFTFDGGFCIKHKNNKARMAIIGSIASVGTLLLLIGAWLLWKILKWRKETKLKEKFFKRNGGLLLKQQLSSGEEGNVEKTNLFTSNELEKATDNFNQNRIIGRGGQGTVYKGMLTDGKIVAVKKSKIEDESKVEEFINEVVILSKINHRNVVKLHGCCLETEVPLLVYEFIPNGTLFQYICDQNEELPLSWDMRLRIAIEIAGALSYLHSEASLPIYHRDVKSENILLDDKYRAKIADFGISRSIPADETHLTTRVMGTFGYLDPEYFRSKKLTEKSDVYSFGVVLVELLATKKQISESRSEEGRSLAIHLILAMEENRLFDLVDARVRNEGKKEEIIGFAYLAKRCLNMNGKERPTMRDVTIMLERIRKSEGESTIQENHENRVELEYDEVELNGPPWDTTSTSAGFSVNKKSLEIQPLLFKQYTF